MAEIRWSPSAVGDLEAINQHIERDSTDHAALVVRRLLAAVERLSSFPRSGRVVPEYRLDALREVVWRDYRIVYWIRADVIEVAAVFHGARLPPELDPSETV